MTVRRAFEPKAAAVRAARVFASSTASGWGIDPGDVETVVGELAANAYVHARSPFTVALARSDRGLSVEVSDESPTMPFVIHNAADLPCGKGLLIVEAIVAAWGARAVGGGKVVWADLAAKAGQTGPRPGPGRART